MATIPDQIDLAQVVGAPQPSSVVAATDFGLGAAGEEASQVAVAQRRATDLGIRAQSLKDSRAIQPDLLKLQSANEADFQTSSVADAGTPGYVADYTARAQDRIQRVATARDMSAGEQAQFMAAAAEETARAGRSAAQAHAMALRAPLEEAAQAQRASQLGEGLTGFTSSFEPAYQALKLNHADGDTDLAVKASAQFDQSAQAAIAAAAPAIQPRLQGELAALKPKYVADALDFQLAHAQTGVLQGATSQVGALANTVLSAPNAYANAHDTGLPAIVAALPRGVQAAALREGRAQLATARIQGLVNVDQPEAAVAELNSGKYDADLEPGQKEQLLASALAATRRTGPKTFDEALSAEDLKRRADADVYAWQTTGKGSGVDLDAIVQQLGPEAAARYAMQVRDAKAAFAATGPVHDMPTADVAAAASASPPDPSDPDYASKIVTFQTQQAAAAQELKARQSPGAWAFTNHSAAVSGPGIPAPPAGVQDRGQQLQDLWAKTIGGQPGAGPAYAGAMVGLQYRAGIAAQARQIIPQAEAQRLAGAVINAPPEGRLHALQGLAAVIQALPATMTLPDGSHAGPQQMMMQQLLAAHLTPMELSAAVDWGNNPAALGRYIAALSDPTLKTPLPHSGDAHLAANVRGALAPYLATVAPLPGAQALQQARIDRTALVAKSLMAGGMAPDAAAQQAAQDASGDYRYVDSWRIPSSIAGGFAVALGSAGPGFGDGAAWARDGAAAMKAGLIANGGQYVYAAGGQRALYAAKVAAAGRWITAPDDSGLMLMVPHSDGTWDQVADKWGRPVAATWSQLQGYGKGQGTLPFIHPPAATPRTDDGAPVPAASKQSSFEAVAWAVEGQESRFHDGLVSPAGALGRMQVMPDTVRAYAPRLGLPVDLDRAQNDNAYNRQIGRAALADLINHFGGGAGIGLAAAAYNAGPGRLEGYRDKKTNAWVPGWLTTIGDPRKPGGPTLTDFVKRIPFAETRAYVQSVLPHALGRLQAGR